MKHLYFFLLLLIPASYFSQNWAPVYPGEKFNYSIDSADVITHTLWVDSTKVINGDSVLYMNTTMGLCDTCSWDSTKQFYQLGSPHFLQKEITNIAFGHYQLRDTGLMDIQAFQATGATWLFEPSSGVMATISQAKDSMLWGQVLDSVKRISLSDGGEILLSKSHGLLFLKRPDYQYRLLGIQEGRVLGEQVPMFWDFYDFEVGDEFHYGNVRHSFGIQVFYNGARRVRILEKERFGNDSVRYRMEDIQNIEQSIIAYSLSSGVHSFKNISCCSLRSNGNVLFRNNENKLVNAWPGEVRIMDEQYPNWDYEVGRVYLIRDSLDKVSKYWGIPEYYSNYPNIEHEKLFSSYPISEETVFFFKTGSLYEGPDRGIEIIEVFYPNAGRYLTSYHLGEGGEGEILLGFIHAGDTTWNLLPQSSFWPTGIEAESISGLKVWPNPVSMGNRIHVDFGDEAKRQLLITSIDGKQILSKKLHSAKTEISTEGYAPGVYQILIKEKSGGFATRRFVVH